MMLPAYGDRCRGREQLPEVVYRLRLAKRIPIFTLQIVIVVRSHCSHLQGPSVYA